MFPLGDVTLLPPLVYFLFMPECCQELLVRPCRSPVSYVWIPACVNKPFLSLEVILENHLALLHLFLSRGLYAIRFFKVGCWAGQSLFWSLGLWSCFCLAPFFQVLNFTCIVTASVTAPSLHSPDLFFLVSSVKSSKVSAFLDSSITCVVKLFMCYANLLYCYALPCSFLADMGIVNFPYKDQGLLMWGFLQALYTSFWPDCV